jgi:hypothetical protein
MSDTHGAKACKFQFNTQILLNLVHGLRCWYANEVHV